MLRTPSPFAAPVAGAAMNPAGPDLTARVARERLTRRLVGLAVLTVVVTAASALLPPRGSAARTAPVPDEGTAGVEVQTVPLGGLSVAAEVADRAPPLDLPPSAPVERQESAPAVASTARTTAEFTAEAPSAARDVPTLKDRAAEAFDERSLAPVSSAPPRTASAKPPAPVLAPPSRRVPPAAPVGPDVQTGAKEAPDRSPTGRDAWVVQVGVFSTRAKADSVVRQMQGAGLPAPQVESVQLASGATRFRVRIPTGGDAESARTVRDRVNALPGAFGAAVKSVPAAG